MSDKAALIVTATPDDAQQEAVKEYLEGVGPLLAAAGGVRSRRLATIKHVHGETFAISTVLDFPSVEAIEGVFASKEYKALIPARDRAFKQLNIVIAKDAEA